MSMHLVFVCGLAWMTTMRAPGLQTSYRSAFLTRMDAGSSDDDMLAERAVAWFDEVAMLEVIFRGQITHDDGAMSATDLEAAIIDAGGNVSAALTLEDRTRPDGNHHAIRQLAVAFSIELDEGLDDEESAEAPRLHVSFDERYPLDGGRPAFSLLCEGSPEEAGAVVDAAAAAAEAALQAGETTVIFSAVGAANDALATDALAWIAPAPRTATDEAGTHSSRVPASHRPPSC